nr:Chain B, TolBp [Pseudomonas aeruginosa]
ADPLVISSGNDRA